MFQMLIFILLFSFSASAKLLVWQPAGYDQSYLIYQSEGESAEESVQRFLKTTQSHPELQKMTHSLVQQKQDTYRSLNADENLLLLANRAEDHSRKASRLNEVRERFKVAGADSLTLPVGATLALSNQERTQFFKEMSQKFSLLVALGGDDVHPQYYKEPITWAVGLKPTRDALEIEIIQNYYQRSQGRIFGICRGLQITSVALGYKLNQDLPKDLGTKLPHNNGAFHDIFLRPTKNGLLSQILDKKSSARVNSYHHQSVKLESVQPDGLLQIAAVAADGVIEALESRDGRILLLQFHPEISDLYTSIGHKFFRFLKEKNLSPRATALSCGKAVGL